MADLTPCPETQLANIGNINFIAATAVTVGVTCIVATAVVMKYGIGSVVESIRSPVKLKAALRKTCEVIVTVPVALTVITAYLVINYLPVIILCLDHPTVRELLSLLS